MNRELAGERLKSAASDLETIDAILENENLTHVVAFHAQQCVEKALKALLEYREEEVPKNHSIVRLAYLVGESFTLDERMGDELDKLYIDSRYPGDLGLLPHGRPGLDEAKSFARYAKSVYEQIAAMIRES